MPRTEARYETGSYLQDLQARWAPLYEQRIGLLGATTTICPMGDPYYGKLNAATFASQYGSSGQAATWTPSSALASLATPFKIPDEIAGLVPAITFNATSERLTTPDADYWSRVAAAFSIIFYAYITDTADRRTFMAKYAASNREWAFEIDTADKLFIELKDESADAQSSRVTDAAVVQGQWAQYVVTQNGNGGATAGAGITFYVNGASVASTATEGVGFVNMENLAATVHIGDAQSLGDWYSGRMAGGPLGPTFVQAALTADTIRRDYDMCRALLPY